MKLIRTINLDFGNLALAAWEQECEKINAANEAAKNNPVYEEVDGWEAREVFDGKWSEDGKERISDHLIKIENSFDARVLGLDFASLPEDGSVRIKNYLVEKKIILVAQKIELQELPSKPDVKVLNKLSAYEIIKSQQPNLKIQFYDLIDHFWENGKKVAPIVFYTTSWTYFDNVVQIETFWRDLGEDGKIFVTRKHYKQEIYRVYPDKFEVWEAEYYDEILPRREGSSSVGECGIGSWSDKGYF